MSNKERGFSLIELLIVVAIILVITATAIPSFVRAKIAANAASAVTSMHAITTSEIGYSTAYPQIGFSHSLASLGPSPSGTCSPTASCFIDPALAAGTKSGYTFLYVPAGGSPTLGFTLNADPTAKGLTGQTSYYADETNSIHYNPTATAGPTDPTL